VDIERIDRLGTIAWHGYANYIQEVRRDKTKTTEKAEIFAYSAIEMSDGCGTRINYLV
jgi:hypothetical protein